MSESRRKREIERERPVRYRPSIRLPVLCAFLCGCIEYTRDSLPAFVTISSLPAFLHPYTYASFPLSLIYRTACIYLDTRGRALCFGNVIVLSVLAMLPLACLAWHSLAFCRVSSSCLLSVMSRPRLAFCRVSPCPPRVSFLSCLLVPLSVVSPPRVSSLSGCGKRARALSLSL